MTVLALVKLAAMIVIPTGVSSVAKQFVKPMLANMTKVEKVCAIAATSAVGGYIADKAVNHVNEQIDELSEKIKGKKNVETVKEAEADGGSD